MQPLARAAAAHGFDVLNLRYPSRSGSVRTLAEFIARAVAEFAPGRPLHFVTHSLGGILVRAAAGEGAIAPHRIARVVMLAPPNLGSEVPDLFSQGRWRQRLFRVALGPAALELGTTPSSAPLTLPTPGFEFGVIAGSRSLNPLLSHAIAGRNDGKVSLARAAHPAMRDFLVVPHSHTFLMRVPRVIQAALHFLEHGRFEP
jgi:triacylglycerol lipase